MEMGEVEKKDKKSFYNPVQKSDNEKKANWLEHIRIHTEKKKGEIETRDEFISKVLLELMLVVMSGIQMNLTIG